MRVTMLAANPTGSDGWGRHAHESIRALAALGVEITLITSTDTPTSDLPVVAYHRLLPPLAPLPRFSSVRLLSSTPRVLPLIRQADVVHVQAEPYALATWGAAKPRIVTAHGTYLPQTLKRFLFSRLYHPIYLRSVIACVSGYTERRVRAALPGANTRVIPNGVNIDRFANISPDIPRPAEAASGQPSILAVGSVKARKGFHVLAKAMSAVRATFPDAQAIFIGKTTDTAYCDAIRAQLRADGQTDAVRWLGRVPDETLLGWYRAADIFALPGVNSGDSFEGFGLVFLEASAAGLPVIGTRDNGAEDAIRDGETGYLVAQNDPAQLADAIIKLLRDPGLRARMGAAGVQHARQYTWERYARSILELYQSL